MNNSTKVIGRIVFKNHEDGVLFYENIFGFAQQRKKERPFAPGMYLDREHLLSIEFSSEKPSNAKFVIDIFKEFIITNNISLKDFNFEMWQMISLYKLEDAPELING